MKKLFRAIVEIIVEVKQGLADIKKSGKITGR